jgi:putative transposase
MDKFMNKYRIPSARAQWWDYGRDGAYFITICTKNHNYFFGDVLNGIMELSESGKIANNHWLEIPEHFPFIQLDAHITMPNHIHGILIINQSANSNEIIDELPEMDMECGDNPGGGKATDAQIGRLSETSESSYLSKKSGGCNPQWHSGTIGVILNQYKRICTINARKINPDFAWQPRFHDHIIRNEQEFDRIAHYITSNPANWKKDKFRNSGK